MLVDHTGLEMEFFWDINLSYKNKINRIYKTHILELFLPLPTEFHACSVRL